MIMKKFIAVILAAAAILTVFASCGKKEASSGAYSYVELKDGTLKITKYTSEEDVLELDIPEEIDGRAVTVIGEDAFAGVETITVVNFPSSLTKVEKNAFAGSSVKKAFLHKSSVTEIGETAFGECHNLVQIDLPRTLTTISAKAFYYCEKLKVASFRGDVENIDIFAFDASPNVKFYIKDSFAKIKDFARVYHFNTVITDAATEAAAA